MKMRYLQGSKIYGLLANMVGGERRDELVDGHVHQRLIVWGYRCRRKRNVEMIEMALVLESVLIQLNNSRLSRKSGLSRL